MKKRESKLDQYAETLLEMDEAKKTIDQMQEWLREEGCVVARSTLSRFLESVRQSRLGERLLEKITSGADLCAKVEKAFTKNPAPGVETLIKLHRSLILQLATQGEASPKLLQLADNMTNTVLQFISGETKARFKERELSLAEDKFHFDAAKRCLEKLETLKAIKKNTGLSEDEKLRQARLELFGSAPA